MYFILFIAMLAILQLYLSVKSHREGSARWSRIAQEMGLSFTDIQPDGPCISGRFRGFNVRISTYLDSNMGARKQRKRLNRVEVDGEGKIDPELQLRAEGLWQGLTKLLGGTDVLTHDAPFDECVHLRGDEPEVLAVMRYPARKAVLEFLKQGNGSVKGGKVVMENGRAWDDADIQGLAHAAVNLAEQLVLPPGATVKTLAANGFDDPLPEVRRRNLECLSAVLCSPDRDTLYASLSGPHPLAEETARSARAALSDANPRLRLVAAMLMGDEAGFAVLKALVESDSVPAELRAQAAVTLMTRFSWERVESIVATALASGCGPLLEATVACIGAEGNDRLIGQVCALSATASDKLLLTIAKTLGELENPAAEPTLIAMLGHSADDVRIAAAQALGKVGTVRAVEPLLLVKGKLLSDVKTTAQQAARAIQSRLVDAEAGRLSVVESTDQRGALSLAGENGRLSLAKQAQAAGAVQALAPGAKP